MTTTPSEPDELVQAFYDRARLRRLHHLVQSCPPDGPPCLELLFPERLAKVRQLAVLAGSFNPLTRAHLALAEASERAGLGGVAFVLSTRTVDKEQPEGALLEDRLLVLALALRHCPDRAVALLNRGLYVDQAELFRAKLPRLERLTFVVGFDKIVQIFDPRYYDDRQATLERLFDQACFAVAPRTGAGPAELRELLAQPDNRPFARGVRSLELPEDLASVSSSAVRAALASGQPLPPDLPAETVAFIHATGCYLPARVEPDGRRTDPYATRLASSP